MISYVYDRRAARGILDPVRLPFRLSPLVPRGLSLLGTRLDVTALGTGELERILQQGSERLKPLYQEDACDRVV